MPIEVITRRPHYSMSSALQIITKLLGSERPYTAATINRLAATLNGQAHLYYKIGEYAKAEPLYQQVLKIRTKLLGPENPGTAATLNDLAVVYDKMRRLR